MTDYRDIMPRARRILLIIIAFTAGFCTSLALKWVGSFAEPVYYVDVNDTLLKNTGFNFKRPASARNACMAIVGHGMGDSCIYLSFDLPEDSLADFFLSQSYFKEIPKSQLGPFPYRDTLPSRVSELIMPKVIPDATKAFSLEAGEGVYDTEKERLHLVKY